MSAQKLNPAFKAKWVEALRSGKYKQGHGLLRNGKGHGGFCCLGVALDLVDPMGWIGNPAVTWKDISPTTIGATAPVIGIDNNTAFLLARMNDGESCDRCSFTEIADYIEANL